MHALYLFFILSIFLLPIYTSEMGLLKILDDFISYRIVFKTQDDYDYKFHNDQVPTWNEERADWIKVKSSDAEEYRCLLPEIREYQTKRIESYTGPSPSELLEPLYITSECSYRMETYWTYEVCHGRYVLQYHDDKETRVRREYYLGNFVSAQAKSNNAIISITEVSSCNYEIVILTNRLCAHPSFQKPLNKEEDIECFSNPMQNRPLKPKSLINIEKENTNQLVREFGIYNGAKDFLNTIFDRAEAHVPELAQINALLEAMTKKKEKIPESKPTTDYGNEENEKKKNDNYKIKVERIELTDDVLKLVERLSDLSWENKDENEKDEKDNLKKEKVNNNNLQNEDPDI